MKKILLTLAAMFLYSGFSFAQNKPFMTLTTSKGAGERIQLIITSNGGFTLEGVEETQGVEGYAGYTLTGSEIKLTGDITEFSAPYVNITAVDITNMPDITSFDIFGNPITSLDLSNNTELKTLIAGATEMTELDISKCPRLEMLNINSAKIESLDLKCNGELVTLLAKNAGLKNLNLAGADMLDVLDCSYNKLGNIDISEATSLTQLSCAGNELTSLDISDRNLLVLNCNVNNLSSLDLSGQTRLEELGCINNNLEYIDFSDCRNLYGVVACGNKINHENMTAVVESLPKVVGAAGYFTIVDTTNDNEKNEMSVSNVKAAADKNWAVLDYQDGMSGYDYGAPYEGIPDDQLSVEAVCSSDFMVYRPANADVLYVAGVVQGADVTICDMTGAVVMTTKAAADVTTVNTAGMPRGAYIVSSGKHSMKVVM